MLLEVCILRRSPSKASYSLLKTPSLVIRGLFKVILLLLHLLAPPLVEILGLDAKPVDSRAPECSSHVLQPLQ